MPQKGLFRRDPNLNLEEIQKLLPRDDDDVSSYSKSDAIISVCECQEALRYPRRSSSSEDDDKHEVKSVRMAMDQRVMEMAKHHHEYYQGHSINTLSIGCGELFQELVITTQLSKLNVPINWTLVDPGLPNEFTVSLFNNLVSIVSPKSTVTFVPENIRLGDGQPLPRDKKTVSLKDLVATQSSRFHAVLLLDLETTLGFAPFYSSGSFSAVRVFNHLQKQDVREKILQDNAKVFLTWKFHYWPDDPQGMNSLHEPYCTIPFAQLENPPQVTEHRGVQGFEIAFSKGLSGIWSTSDRDNPVFKEVFISEKVTKGPIPDERHTFQNNPKFLAALEKLIHFNALPETEKNDYAWDLPKAVKQ